MVEKIDALGGLLKRIGNFDPSLFQSDFNSRLVLQKTIYLMEQFGLNIGYSFSWYLRGPYSPNLTRDAYEVTKSYRDTPPVKFVEPTKEQRFCEFLNFIKPISTNAYYLEKLAVVHFLYSMYSGLPLREIFEKVHTKISNINYNEYEQLLNTLRTHDLIGDRE